ncbi:MAG: DUF1153 domain-containing protein [Kiloniellaceae bacterium]
MASDRPGRLNTVIGPAGQPLTIDDLPPPETQRWVIRRKAEVVAGVRNGLISLEDACNRYKLSVEEFLSWQRLIEAHGVRGLRTTRLQQYRRASVGNDQPTADKIPHKATP